MLSHATRGSSEKDDCEQGMDFTSINSTNKVLPGNFIVCRGDDYYEIMTATDDCFFPEGTRDSVRVTRDFTKNVNKQPFDIVKDQKLRGEIQTFQNSVLDKHSNVTVQLQRVNINNFGVLKVQYNNACFNSLGFLTHDAHSIM